MNVLVRLRVRGRVIIHIAGGPLLRALGHRQNEDRAEKVRGRTRHACAAAAWVRGGVVAQALANTPRGGAHRLLELRTALLAD